jgi:hypothetical protein
MKAYRPLEAAVGTLRTDQETLLEFSRAGWIEVIWKNGRAFLSSQDEYRARFILHLRQKLKLTDKEIGIVLGSEKPPYSLDRVPAVLARHAADR